MESTKFYFPKEIKRMISTLGDENQWSILEVLINNDNVQTYSKIMNTVGIPKGTLNYHLKELQKNGWLRKWVNAEKIISESQPSFYEITKFGLRILEGAMKATIPSSYESAPMDLFRFPDNRTPCIGVNNSVTESAKYRNRIADVLSNKVDITMSSLNKEGEVIQTEIVVKTIPGKYVQVKKNETIIEI